MTPAPQTPPSFQAIVPSPSSTLCGNFTNVILKLPLMIWQMFNYMFDTNGYVSVAFRQNVVPSGQLIFMAGQLPSTSNYLLCDGSEVSKSTYAALYTAIGDAWGAASNSANFKLPDFRGFFPVGVGSFPSGAQVALGQNVGSETVKLTTDQMPPHTHTIDGLYAVGLARNAALNGASNSDANADASPFELTSNSTGGAGSPPAVNGHPNIPPSLGAYVYIAV